MDFGGYKDGMVRKKRGKSAKRTMNEKVVKDDKRPKRDIIVLTPIMRQIG
jgi:hypothetical protein